MTGAFIANMAGRLTGVPGVVLAQAGRREGPVVIEAIVDGSRYAELLHE